MLVSQTLFLLLSAVKQRGAQRLRAEITPYEPDSVSTGEGICYKDSLLF